MQQVILKILNELFDSRIVVANSCVVKLYKEEYHVLDHLQNLRKVFLLESSDLMYEFYSNVFSQVRKAIQ